MKRAFTLIELLIVVALITIMLGVVAPLSISMYKSYEASLKAEKLLIYISSLRRSAFLYGEVYEISSKDTKLEVNDKPVNEFENFKVGLSKPIYFYDNGTSSGGVINLEINKYMFKIKVKSPSGELSLENY